MRPGIIPEGIIERIALLSGLVPTPLLELYWGIALSRTLLAGIRLGIFDQLEKGGKSASKLAEDCQCHPIAMEHLLNALNGFGYLRRQNGKYWLKKNSAKWFLKTSPRSMRDSFLFMGELFSWFDQIETIVKTGNPPRFHDPSRPPEFWETYLRGLANFARYVAPEIARKVSLKKKPEKLLDVGGGHGIYSIAFCRRYPELKAEILDLPQAVEAGKKLVEEQGFSSQISFRPADLLTSDWGEGYDLVLIFNVIHIFTPEQVEEIFIKAKKSLSLGGRLVFLDSEHTGGEKDLSATSGFNQLLFYLINGTKIYPEEKIKSWLAQAGFKKITKKRLLRVPMSLFLIAEK